MMFDAQELATASGGRCVHPAPAGPLSTDSRRIVRGDWFLALVGDRFDAHKFLGQVRAAGCAGVIANQVPDGWDRGFVQVDDTLEALQNIATHARTTFSGPVVGITGSAGKTTTRAMVALAIGALGQVHATFGNLNNHIGVPLTLLAAPLGAGAWVVEMGMNALGEIALLQRISMPTIRLVTNVGAAHLEGVGDLDGVARAKGELFDGARRGDVCCINLDDPKVRAMPLPEGVRVIGYGAHPDADVRLTDATVDADTLETRFRIETHQGSVLGRIASPGLHLARNATAALAVAVALHLDPVEAGKRLSTYEPVGMRQRVQSGPGGLRVINDAYNANPLSTRASVDTLAAISGTRRVALLGDMLELGATEDRLHTNILAHALTLGLDMVGTAGPRYARARAALINRGHSQADSVHAAPTAPELAQMVGESLVSGDVVLLKGSRGMRMETILDHLPTAPAPEA